MNSLDDALMEEEWFTKEGEDETKCEFFLFSFFEIRKT
jgi:hypothetical protein